MESIQLPANIIGKIPFLAEEQLSNELKIVEGIGEGEIALARSGNSKITALPENPFVDLQLSELHQYVRETIETGSLDKLAPYLWLISTQSSSSVTPLHQHTILGRTITITQSASLHLVWYYDKVFIKPLPRYLLSHSFWAFLFGESSISLSTDARERLYRAAVGFVRSYIHLVRDEVDFRLAAEAHLIPPEVTLDTFAIFMKRFRGISNDCVSPRFRYGELRLSRLNYLAPFVLRRLDYFSTARQTETYFSRYFQPLLFAFGILSVLLSAMQLALAADPPAPDLHRSWVSFVQIAKWASVATMLLVTAAAISLLGLFLFKWLNEAGFAMKSLYRRTRGKRLFTASAGGE